MRKKIKKPLSLFAMNNYLVPLYFRNAMRIGAANAGIGIEESQDFIHSDTLWAALCNYWAILGEVEGISFDTFLDSFKKGKPIFKISSAFPMTEDGRTFWLPKPLSVPFSFSHSNEDRQSEIEQYAKIVKKTRFIASDVFKRWIEFEANNASEVDKNLKGVASGEVRPHNTLDRASMASQIFHSGITYFSNSGKNRAGLYFILRADDATKRAVEKVLEVIWEVGAIGGDRGTGLGALAEKPICLEAISQGEEWEMLNGIDNSNAFCLLSLCYSTENQLYQSALSYQLILRKGWTGSLSVGTQVKRQTISMFSEGSIFGKEPTGQLVDVTPQNTPKWQGLHPVYRYGYALSVPIRLHFDDYKLNEEASENAIPY